tara:strand:+ start:1239 stop:1445 length:207 start_codon:yes stop_codon:yes gene_type:complete
MVLKGLIDRIKISFCCKSKCSLNEIMEELNEGKEWIDTLEDNIDTVIETIQEAQKVVADVEEEPKKNI